MQKTIGILKALFFLREEGGTSAVEFSVFAPVLLLGALMSVDVGFALGERMELDHIVRVGAESAMLNQEESKVLQVMASTVEKNFSLASNDSDGTYQSGDEHPVTLSADQYCACPGAGASSCSNACAGDLPPNVFFDVGATKTYSGILLPDINFSAGMRVQLR